MEPLIHPNAVISPGAKIGADVRIGPFCTIGDEVEIGDRCVIGPNCTITGPTRIGPDNTFAGHCSIGSDPQDKKYKGERVELVIGAGNCFREFCTVNRGTGEGGGITRIGDRNWFLAYVHVAHDCIVGDDCVFSNNATLAGHVEIGNHVILSGFAGVHQFCRIGDHAFIGMGAFVNGDVPPFVIVAQESYSRPRGINAEGLKRRGFDAERIALIKRAYRSLFVSGATLSDAREIIATLQTETGNSDLKLLLDFLDSAQRPLLR
ncbi:acyl-ACP--UDP-N-acetylglucosamine O-acyltransferase [Luteimonas sp. FXH3W]|uniref:Acyl-[acyl-carrier-protein]--UDP-N-acetylglucosamine O-acyltransferase n=1 Tax=Aquilutibacter rugosus TaxID=3115820 RepID=A0ABU7V264_9GAMM